MKIRYLAATGPSARALGLGGSLLALSTGCFKADAGDDEIGGDTSTATDTDTSSATETTTTDTTTTDTATDTTTGSDPVCGNAMVELGEECDDGDMDDTDACTNACTLAACGDLSTQAGVEECDDGNLDDADACTNACMNATCGDGFVYAGVEDCDDGNLDDTDACTNACTNAACGDGFVQAGVEECDDGNLVDVDGCSSACAIEAMTVFVTSTTHKGNLGGLAGADAICMMRAAQAGLRGSFKAWISTSQANGTPATRFTQSTLPYRKVDGVVIADNWADLTDGTLASPIDLTESGALAPASVGSGCSDHGVWTATTPEGTLFDPQRNCSNWTSTLGGKSMGRSNATDPNWTVGCSLGSAFSPYCGDLAPLYCFQQ